MSTLSAQPTSAASMRQELIASFAVLTKQRLALAAILLVGLAYATVIQNFSWNQASHYDLIRALRQRPHHDRPPPANTGDKVFYRRHWYSARAPGLALFALPFYDALNLVGADSWRARPGAASAKTRCLSRRSVGQRPARAALAAAGLACRRAHAAGLRGGGGRHAWPGDAVLPLHASVLTRLHRVPRLCRLRADGA